MSRGRVRPDRTSRRGEEGFTLLEVMIVLIVLGVLLVITIPVVSTLEQTTSRVTNTYTSLNGQLELSTTLQRLLRAAVAPAPPLAGKAPGTGNRTPFVPGELTPTSMSFYANVGTTNGPVEVTAQCAPITPTHAYLCAATSRFTVTMIRPNAGSCPTIETSTKTCTYPTASGSRLLVSITHIQNGTDAKPLFVYSYGIQPALGTPLSVTTVCVTTTALPATCTGSDATTLDSTSCAAPTTNATDPYAKCPVGAVDDVVYDLQINVRTTRLHRTRTTPLNGGYQVEDATGTFVLSATSVLFDPAVG